MCEQTTVDDVLWQTVLSDDVQGIFKGHTSQGIREHNWTIDVLEQKVRANGNVFCQSVLFAVDQKRKCIPVMLSGSIRLTLKKGIKRVALDR